MLSTAMRNSLNKSKAFFTSNNILSFKKPSQFRGLGCPVCHSQLSSRITVNRRVGARIVERTQVDRSTGVHIRHAAEKAHQLVHLVLASRSATRKPRPVALLADPLERTGCIGGEAVALIEDLIAVAQVDKVDEDGAGGSGAGVCQEAVIGVYVDGLRGFGVLATVVLVGDWEIGPE